MNTIKVDKLEINNDKPFVLIAGLNVLEDEKTIESVITKCIESTSKHNIPFTSKHLMTKLIDPQLIRTGAQGPNKV